MATKFPSGASSLSKRLRKTYVNPFHIARNSVSNILKQKARFARGIMLDVGCGEKPYFELFSEKVKTYIGLDLPSSNSTSADILADALHLPFRSQSLDTVLSTEVIEHVPEPQVLLNEINRVLKKEGILILSAPLVWGLHSEPCDYFRFTKYGLKYLMEKANFQMLFLQQTCGFWAAHGQRLSDFLFQRYSKNRVGKTLIVPMCMLIQLFSTTLDKAFSHEGETLDYVVTASKK